MLKSDENKKNQYWQYLFQCSCYTHLLRVIKFDNEEEVYLDKFTSGCDETTVFGRIKIAVGYIFNPRKYTMFGDFVFTKLEARKLAQLLSILTLDKRDIETGKQEYKSGVDVGEPL